MKLLPKGWVECRLGDVLELVNGRAYKKNEMLEYSEKNIPILRIQNLNGGDNWFYSDLNLSAEKYCYKGDLLYAWSATFGPYWAKWDKVIFHYHIWNVKPTSLITIKFAYYVLFNITAAIKSAAHGVAMPHMTKSGMENWNVAIPSLPEQKRIVAKLDEVLAQVDTIKARLDSIPAILKRFRQSVLAAAVSGKLTEEWRGCNELLGWKDSNIGNISIVETGKTPKRTEPRYWDSADVAWLTSSATGNVYCDASEQYVSSYAVDDCKLKLFKPGTLLLAMYGEGKTRGQVTELKIEATCNQACAAIRVDESMALTSYVKLRLLENYEETRKAAAGGNQPNLNLNKVREIAITLPPIEEQKEIVRLVDQYFTFADTIEVQVKKAQARVDNLTQSILAKAFRGELVPQDPDDEPAEELLKRIATARKEAEALAKAAKKAAKAPRKE